MTLGELVDRANVLAPMVATPADTGSEWAERARTPVTAIEYDSRQVRAGSAFVALRGLKSDGTQFAEDAVARGAVAVVAEVAPPAGWTAAPWFIAADARAALAALAHVYFERPSEHLLVIGLTGTNGKTTTSWLVEAVFERAGVRCGRIGTVSYKVGQTERDASRTTPEAPDLQQLLREMVGEGAGACAMEVSSHALALKRVAFMRFAAAVFTNLTRDHLDFHGDMESYFRAKKQLFEMLPPSAPAILNVDDPRGAELAASVDRPVTYAIDHDADVRPAVLSAALDGVRMDVRTPRGLVHVAAHLPGRPNVSNMLAAIAVGIAFDLPVSAIEEGISDVALVPGRFEVVSDADSDVAVVVDYAHTDDALKNLLETARPLARGRLITVFGCGGDRDRTKRPLMGAVAARLSDRVVLTSDNPRSEDPARIIDEIRSGIGTGAQARGAPNVLVIVDRRAAIERAVEDAKPGDLVVVAGKGHEKTQVIGDRVIPFDDVSIARASLARRRSRAPAS
jgi:UDP-N-acetylmuramoyl-L-alanyl-D-glutamate--2,6-diaminopimelate ligase